jgi:NAD+ kinase
MSASSAGHVIGEPLQLRRAVVVRKVTVLDFIRRDGDVGLEEALRRSPERARRVEEADREHRATVEAVRAALHDAGVRHRVVERLTRREVRRADLVITVGGDGTFLRASHCVDVDDAGRSVPMLGVNSSPNSSLGFFCASTRHDFRAVLDELLAGQRSTRGLWRMSVRVNGKPLRDQVLNDGLLAHHVPAETTRYSLILGERRQYQKSSGLWIATAAGSTAAIHSAGGEILPLDDRRLQLRVRELFRPSVDGVAIDAAVFGDELVVESHMPRGVLYLDGGQRRVSFGFGDRIGFRPSAWPLPWVADPEVDARRVAWGQTYAPLRQP